MAKFTVFFKDVPIQSGLFDSGVVNIGRDSSNQIIIDSLAIAPVHIEATINGEEAIVRQLDPQFPMFVNGQQTQQCTLHNNDKIAIGKHVILFNITERNFASEQPAAPQPAGSIETAPVEHKAETRDAGLQILSGQHIGKLIPLKKAMTRLGNGNFGVVIISKRRDGYFISALDTHPSLKVNNQPLGDSSVKLKDNDRVVIDNTPMQFFFS